jgi:translation initiation factor 3 subunit F
MVGSLLLPLGGVNVKVHPVVLLQVCDAYIRRNEKQERVIGTLLGSSIDGVVEVKSCYVVPHNESADQVAVDIVHHKTMYDLHQKVSPAEVILGWFSTGAAISSSDALIQEFYSKETSTAAGPVHLIADTTLANDKFTVQAFVSRALALGDKALATEFQEVPCEVLLADAEKVGVDLLLSGITPKPLADQEDLQTSIKRLQALMGTAREYVSDVLEGKRQGDAAIGRYLTDTLAVVPALAPEDFDKMFNEGVQDQLLVSYFSHVVRSQLALAERLGTAALPLL